MKHLYSANTTTLYTFPFFVLCLCWPQLRLRQFYLILSAVCPFPIKPNTLKLSSSLWVIVAFYTNIPFFSFSCNILYHGPVLVNTSQDPPPPFSKVWKTILHGWWCRIIYDSGKQKTVVLKADGGVKLWCFRILQIFRIVRWRRIESCQCKNIFSQFWGWGSVRSKLCKCNLMYRL